MALWPWLAIAAAGALHGLNPAGGWLFAAVCAVRSGQRRQALRSLLPVALGHAASVMVVAAAVAGVVALGWPLDPGWVQGVAGGLLALLALHHLCGRSPQARRTASGWLALGSFVVGTLQGAGLMLVPALVPLCMGDAAVREITASGSVALALAAVALHMAAMLAVTGGLALAAVLAQERLAGRFAPAAPSRASAVRLPRLAARVSQRTACPESCGTLTPSR